MHLHVIGHADSPATLPIFQPESPTPKPKCARRTQEIGAQMNCGFSQKKRKRFWKVSIAIRSSTFFFFFLVADARQSCGAPRPVARDAFFLANSAECRPAISI